MNSSTCRSAPDPHGDGASVDSASGAGALVRSEYTCAVTGYSGFEAHILRLRNANRDDVKTRRYLDWRYKRHESAPEPKVFWLLSPSGDRVGVASIIWRPYWIDGVRTHVAVLGDISLHADLRGKGLGRQLLAFVTDYLQDTSEQTALVIPTDSARTVLTSLGWQTAGRMIHHVLPVNPEAKMRGRLGARLGALGAHLFRAGLWSLLRLQTSRQTTLEIVSSPDESCDALWQQVEKDHAILRDRTRASLRWRFAEHPIQSFHFAKLVRGKRLLAYAVFSIDHDLQSCVIYDVLAPQASDASSLLARFAAHWVRQGGISTIRLILSDAHPCRRRVRRLGFLPRSSEVAFQVYSSSERPRQSPPLGWWMTAGDKDI